MLLVVQVRYQLKIALEKYNPDWENLFEKEKELLLRKIGQFYFGAIEHVGSTSVKGLIAKPIIDVMFGVKDLESSRGAIGDLSDLDYCYYPYKGDVMHWFCKPSPDDRTHHLHLVPFESKLWFERTRFRDKLRTNSDVAAEYSTLKISLASKHAFDREAYTNEKWPFIKSVLSNSHY